MESSIFKFIIRFSMKAQVTVLMITTLSLPFYYLSLEIPKKIINRALGTVEGDTPAAPWAPISSPSTSSATISLNSIACRCSSRSAGCISRSC